MTEVTFWALGKREPPACYLVSEIMLEPVPGHHEVVKFAASAVASFLRICISIAEDRNWSLTTYPSEPFFSCVAALLLHKECNLDMFPEVLWGKILSRMIDVGKSGESSSQSRMGESGIWSSLTVIISVIEYCRFLFGENCWDTVGKEAKDVFRDPLHCPLLPLSVMEEMISVSKNATG
ncbi:hypothetical protein EDC04DRAFT_2605046 [Pisolithus marmoratus]|nr:hypothetical protein EDC04DRAFT_2605046 [Pisolithus marmoratus]